MKQSIIFTCLPNGISSEGGDEYLNLSVIASIRLQGMGSSTLNDFPDILAWPEKVLNAQYEVHFSNGKVFTPELMAARIDTELWQELMHRDIKVKDFKQEDFKHVRIHSYPVQHVQDFVLEAYQKFAVTSPDRLIEPEKIITDPGFKAISKYKIDEQVYDAIKNSKRKTKYSERELVSKIDPQQSEWYQRFKKTGYWNYSPVKNPEVDFMQLRDFHRVDRPIYKGLLPKVKKPEFEFHDILSITGNYPQIQRKLGVVLDFKMKLNKNINKTGHFRIEATEMGLAGYSDVICAATAYRKTNKGFYLREKNSDFYDRGVVKINTPKFTTTQIDADGAALKMNNFAENQVIEEVKRVMTTYDLKFSRSLQRKGLAPMREPEKEGLPTTRSAGIGIALNGYSEELFGELQRTMDLENILVSLPPKDPVKGIIVLGDIFYAEDLIQGYRMDVAYDNDPNVPVDTGKWHSLHKKRDEYVWYDEGGNPHTIDELKPDEGFIQPTVAEDTENDGDYYASETMARWEGWSLSVRRPGYAINEAKDHEADDDADKRDFIYKNKADELKKYQLDDELDFRLETNSGIEPGSLPRLRFGRSYMLKVRTVDLAGNSIPVDVDPENVKETVICEFPYFRFDALNTPDLLPGTDMREGETVEHMVIRSNYDTSAGDYENKYGEGYDKTAVRHVVPPRNGQQIVEHHGKFDDAFWGNVATVQELYKVIKERDSQENRFDEGVIYKKSEVEIDFLPDPMAAGVAFFLSDGYGHTHSQDFDPRMFCFYKNKEITSYNQQIDIPENYYEKAKSLRIILVEGTKSFDWDPTDRKLTVALPKGERIKLRYSSFWRKKDVEELSGIWNLILNAREKNLDSLKELAFTGRHWMISPFRELELVHATQQPVDQPVIDDIVPDRDYDTTFSYINTAFTLHGFSTQKVDFQAKWKEDIDDLNELNPSVRDFTGMISDVRINYHEKEITKGAIPEEGVVPAPLPAKDMEINKGERVKVETARLSRKEMLTKRLSKNSAISQLKPGIARIDKLKLVLPPLQHMFGDTKHRWVDYKIVAESRYGNYFDKILEKYKDDGLITTRESEWTEQINILSSVRPLAPEIEYIIPTFEWKNSAKTQKHEHIRYGGGLRVYMKRPWFSSGVDEKLAVVLREAAPQMAIAMFGNSYAEGITQWGIDPIRVSTKPDTTGPLPQHFRYNPHVESGLSYPGREQLKVRVVAFPVEFDESRGLWFCDISIDAGQMYFPFVKLALARYQQHAVRKDDTDVCLSPVIMSDFMQLVPPRKAIVEFKTQKKNSKFTVTVEGVIDKGQRSSRGAKNYVDISIHDSLLAQPIQGYMDDGTSERKLEKHLVRIDITDKVINNNYFKITHEFDLPSKYNNETFEVIVEEFELPGTGYIRHRGDTARDELKRPVFTDVFKINEKKKEVK